MATTAQVLNLTCGQHNNAHEVCVCSKAKTLYVFLPAFTIAYGQRVPISAGGLFTTG